MPSTSLLVAALAVIFGSSASVSNAGPCLGTSDTAQRYVKVVRNQVFMGDSTRLAALGLPYKPASGVALETDSMVCAAVVSAFNALYPPEDSTRHIQAGYVIRVGDQAFAFIRPKGAYEGPTSFLFFDEAYQFLVEIS
jgi:hypothetical protein